MTPALPSSTMKSIQWTCPNKNRQKQLSFNNATSVPTLSGSQVLIKVHATSVNPIDWKIMKGGMLWHLLPKFKTPGLDVAGTVVALGPEVGQADSELKIQIGDEVMAMLDFRVSGAMQEYAVADVSLITRKPQRWSFEQAAAYPTVATLVWISLVDRGKIKRGDKVLINGASGGTGKCEKYCVPSGCFLDSTVNPPFSTIFRIFF